MKYIIEKEYFMSNFVSCEFSIRGGIDFEEIKLTVFFRKVNSIQRLQQSSIIFNILTLAEAMRLITHDRNSHRFLCCKANVSRALTKITESVFKREQRHARAPVT